MLDADIKAKEGRDVTGSWNKASLYALWTGVSSGTGLVSWCGSSISCQCLCVSGVVFHGHLLMDSGVGMP
jgi:hypothetical protein